MRTTRRQAIQLIGCSLPALWIKQGVGQQATNPALAKDNTHYPLERLRPDEAAFFNSDHAPVGAHVSLVYGMESSGGLMMLDVRREQNTPLMVQDGIAIAVKEGPTRKAKVMPFCPGIADSSLAEFADKSSVRRVLRACVDSWDMGYGVSWRHYSPYWILRDIDHASASDIARFLLPATWMTFQIDNRQGSEVKSFLFSLLDKAVGTQKSWGDHHGFVLSKQVPMARRQDEAISVVNSTHAVAAPSTIGKLLSVEEAHSKFGIANAGTAIEVEVPSGQTREFTLVIAHYNDQPLINPGNGKLYLTKYYSSIDSVVQAAIRFYPAAKRRAESFAADVRSSGINEYRQILYGHALASYMFNTRLFRQEDGEYLWSIIEGEYDYINTFDLVVDQVFLELAMHPWTVRNELDLYASRFNYVDRVKGQETSSAIYDGGLTFDHDMGGAFTYKTHDQAVLPYPLMSQEELQNWIICAGLYWKKTNDEAWLKDKQDVLKECLKSMLVRDDIDPAKRDGVTTYTSTATAPAKAAKQGEITTFDSLDASLKFPANSGYIATKSFASYLALEAMFTQLGDTSRARSSQSQAKRVADTICSHFDRATNSFPARFNGESDARVIPAIEGLAYPYCMGLKNAVSRAGPYGNLITLLRTHMDSVLHPGICLDQASGAWKMSTSTTNTWESKIYLAQFVTERVLGLKDERTHGKVDAVHYEIQVLGNPVTAWTDQILSDTGATRGGSRHYPRGVTAYLWTMKS